MIKYKSLVVLIVFLPVVYGVSSSSGGGAKSGVSNNAGGSVYIMNGGVTTYPDGTSKIGGSNYNSVNGQNIPLEQGTPREGNANDRSTLDSAQNVGNNGSNNQ